MLICDVELAGRRVDLKIRNGVIAQIGAVDPARHGREPALDGGGGAVLPGLHDHHVHLLATAAALTSLTVGPPEVRDAAGLARALRGVRGPGWVRGIGYDESVAGLPDRYMLDALRADAPVRMQHRSGALWLLNSMAVDALGLTDHDALPEGVERDARGELTGRVWRADDWLGQRLRDRAAVLEPDLAPVGARLASYGITGVTDASPILDSAALGAVARARATGALPQHLMLLRTQRPADGPWTTGPAKIVVGDHALPDFDDLLAAVRAAHADGRAVAVHCVTRTALVLTVTALTEAGSLAGDRIEHAAVVPHELRTVLRELGLTVVTQPSLVARRGDQYLQDVDAPDRPLLWPNRSLVDAGVPVACSSDAPYGDLDPWAGLRAARDRRAASGRVVGAGERVEVGAGLAGYLTAAERPGGPVRRLTVGAPADLVVMDAPITEVLADPDARHVRATLVDGKVVHGER